MYGTNRSVGNLFISNKAWIRGLNVGDSLPKGMSDGEEDGVREELHDSEEKDVGDLGEVEAGYQMRLTLGGARPKRPRYVARPKRMMTQRDTVCWGTCQVCWHV